MEDEIGLDSVKAQVATRLNPKQALIAANRLMRKLANGFQLSAWGRIWWGEAIPLIQAASFLPL